MKTVLEINNLNVSFDEKQALNNLTFKVQEGEVFGFLGPSGAGKTTTIKAITGQLKVDSECIQLFGTFIEDYSSSVFDTLGVMTDSNDVYDNLSVQDNLTFFADIKNIPLVGVDTLLNRVGLYDDRKKLAKKLSRGMRQRLILASALIHQPKLLFLDEPTSALDPKTTADIHELLRDINKQGTTIFLTTHSMSEAEKLCDTIAFIDQGTVKELGTKQELQAKYARDEICIEYSDGTSFIVSKNQEGLKVLSKSSQSIKSVHSHEPSLESIYLHIMGGSNNEIA